MGSGPSLEVTGKTAADPATQRRQEHLWQNAERFAAGQPFQQEYGYGSQMVPGLTGMQQTGQQYLTDKILGKGAYGYQSLGFQDYRRPVDAPQSNFQYGQSGYPSVNSWNRWGCEYGVGWWCLHGRRWDRKG